MKRFIIIAFLFVSTFVYSQNKQSDYLPIEGSFAYKMDHSIIYASIEDGEYPLHTIYNLDITTNKVIIIDSLIEHGCFTKISDTILAYIKNDSLFLYNITTHKPLFSKIRSNVIGLSKNPKHNCMLLFEVDYCHNIVTIKLFDKSNSVIFFQEITYPPLEEEGIRPEKIETFSDYFVFDILDQLYLLDLSDSKPELKLITDRCYYFAINSEGILYYKDIGKLLIKGYFMDFKSKNNRSLKLSDRKRNCYHRKLLSTNVNGAIIPVYLICDDAFAYLEDKWLHLTEGVIVFKDEEVEIKLSNLNNDTFLWKKIKL